jgi:hypothetical protein
LRPAIDPIAGKRFFTTQSKCPIEAKGPKRSGCSIFDVHGRGAVQL